MREETRSPSRGRRRGLLFPREGSFPLGGKEGGAPAYAPKRKTLKEKKRIFLHSEGGNQKRKW